MLVSLPNNGTLLAIIAHAWFLRCLKPDRSAVPVTDVVFDSR